MCYNCGCGKVKENMGNPKNITLQTFEEAAKAANEPVDKAKKNTFESLKKELGEKK